MCHLTGKALVGLGDPERPKRFHQALELEDLQIELLGRHHAEGISVGLLDRFLEKVLLARDLEFERHLPLGSDSLRIEHPDQLVAP